MKVGLIIILSFISLDFCGQTKISPEEIAFNHLIRLMKVDSNYSVLKFTTKGKILDFEFSELDTMFCRTKGLEIIFKNPFGDNVVINDQRMEKFNVPTNFKNNRKFDPVRIYRHFKVGYKYYVLMNFQDGGMSGYNVTMILNEKGDLLKECLSTWIK